MMYPGNTRMIGTLRVHRFHGSMRITDTALAGKRGKKCAEFHIEDRNGWGSTTSAAMSEVAFLASEAADADAFLGEVGEICASAPDDLIFTAEYKRGVDVEPNIEPVVISNEKMGCSSTPLTFSARDRTDPMNEPTLILSGRSERTSAAKIFRWLSDHRAEAATMSFYELWTALREKAGATSIHYYCAMD